MKEYLLFPLAARIACTAGLPSWHDYLGSMMQWRKFNSTVLGLKSSPHIHVVEAAEIGKTLRFEGALRKKGKVMQWAHWARKTATSIMIQQANHVIRHNGMCVIMAGVPLMYESAMCYPN